MSRFCVVEYTGDRPDKNPAPLQRPPLALVDHMVPMLRQAAMLGAANRFQAVAFSEAGRMLLDRFEDQCDAAIKAAG